MATYFNKYYIEFEDNHVTSPITWRVDILDSQGIAPTEPYKLIASAQPLVTRRINTADDKMKGIIGREITISYEYTGNPNEPLPELFFEADERRYRAEVRKNGVLDGVYFIKPDDSQYPDVYPPFTISLSAVDGLGYSEGTLFNSFDDEGLLYYEKVPIYEALVTRALYQIFDPGTVVNVIQSLVPNGASPGDKLLFDSWVHLDAFYDFVTGPLSVKRVLEAFCMSFNATILTEENQIWFIRVQDLNYSSYSIEQYIDSTTVNTVVPTDFVRDVGPNFSNDAIPIHVSGLFRMLPAIKRAVFETKYKGINQLVNFLWAEWDGANFTDWFNVSDIALERDGDGTIENPYRAFLPAFVTETANEPWINQFSGNTTGNTFKIGDIVDVEARFEFHNTIIFQFSIVLQSLTVGTQPQVLGQDGTWSNFFPNGPVDYNHRIICTRSGIKKTGSFRIKSKPLPQIVGDNPYLEIYIYCPNRLSYHIPAQPGDIIDGSAPDGVYVYPIKVGIIGTGSEGRRGTITNNATFSQVKDPESFTFIDTGEDGLSNTIFTGPTHTPEDGGWESPKPGVTPSDIERHMSIGYIDQYQRSVTGYEATLYSNSLSFYNVLTIQPKPGKLFKQISDTYDNRRCEHNVVMAEVFREGTSSFEYAEIDLEDAEKD